MLASDYELDNYRSAEKVSKELPIGGRRIYVHNYSLRCLARRSSDLANQIALLMAEVRAAKIVHHQVADLGLGLGLVRESTAERLVRSEWKIRLADFFRTLGYRPSFPLQRSMFLPLIERDEQIVASCSYSGYYTFATGVSASDAMFADEHSISELQRSLTQGDGPADLTMIRGSGLAPVDSALGTGKVGYRYSAALKHLDLTEADLDLIDKSARDSFLQDFQRQIAEVTGLLTSDERQVLSDTLQSVQRSFAATGSLSL